MTRRTLTGAILLGIYQGITEWIPVSSGGQLTVLLTMFGYDPDEAVHLSFFLHLGTAVSASGYYYDDLCDVFETASEFSLVSAFDDDTADLSFLAVSFAISLTLGLLIYRTVSASQNTSASSSLPNTQDTPANISASTEPQQPVTSNSAQPPTETITTPDPTEADETEDTGFTTFIGALLVLTGIVQRFVNPSASPDEAQTPTAFDAILTGIGQSLSVIPGISRSGSTISTLLLRGFSASKAMRLSFLLSIPTAVAAGVFGLIQENGVPRISPTDAVAAFLASAVTGYLTIETLTEYAKNLPFWKVCIGFGALTIFSDRLKSQDEENQTPRDNNAYTQTVILKHLARL